LDQALSSTLLIPLSRGEKVGLPELEAECGALVKRQIRRGERHSRHEGQFRKRGRGDDCRCGVFDASWILSIEDAALGNLTSALTALQPSLRGKIGGIEDCIPALARVDSPQR
jgi:hypothetical protein